MSYHSLWKVDRWIFLTVAALLLIGAVMVYSTTAITSLESHGDSARMLKHHLLHILLSFFALALGLSLSPERLYKISGPLLLFALFLLLITLIPGIGHVAGGARRWLVFGPLRVQPGEIAKLVAVIYFSAYISRHNDKMKSLSSGLFTPLIVLGVMASLLLMEPDFGSTAIILCVVFCQLFLVCRVRHMLALGSLAAAALSILVLTSPYRLKRFASFWNPHENASSTGYQLMQSLIAVGSGGLSGAGLGSGKQKLFYLPAAHTDFIFAVIAEELGIAGALLVLGLFLFLLVRGIKLTSRLLDEPYLASLALGCTLLMVVPAILNMGVVLGMLPTKGMVLPLVAYGGTSMLVHMMIVGILLRLSRREI